MKDLPFYAVPQYICKHCGWAPLITPVENARDFTDGKGIISCSNPACNGYKVNYLTKFFIAQSDENAAGQAS